MDPLPISPWRVTGAKALVAGSALASAAFAVVLARDGSSRTAAAVILSAAFGFGAGKALRLLDHVRLPSWVEVGGIPAALFVTTLFEPSDHALAMYLAGFGGLLLSIVVRQRQPRTLDDP
jgi:hypothetical protein